MDDQQEPIPPNRGANPKQDDITTTTLTTPTNLNTTTTTTTTTPSTPTRLSRRTALNIDFLKLAGECYEDDSPNNNNLNPCNNNIYANKHIPSLLERNFNNNSDNDNTTVTNILQTVTDGSQLTATNLINPNHTLSLHNPILITDTPTSIGMKVPLPKPPSKDITIRQIGNKIGMSHSITVMDVRTQDELDGWNFQDMVDHFEDEDRQYKPTLPQPHSRSKRRNRTRVLNQISLEFSLTPLGKLVTSPQFVRDLDWIEHIWPRERKQEGDYPRVQYYCLTSTSGCFTDFHVDFGGTSVWYHVLMGKKVFLLVPPSENNMKLYEKWLCRKDQNDIFFPDMKMGVDDGSSGSSGSGDGQEQEQTQEQTQAEQEQTLVGVENCVKITLEKGQTFIIPTGWIHAVYTPIDSLVIGGNFLHGFDIKGQLDVHCLETRTRVPAKFRFPSFVQLCFYAGAEYFKRLLNPLKFGIVQEQELNGIQCLVNALRMWNVGPGGDANRYGGVAYVESQIVKELGVSDMDDVFRGIEEGLSSRNGRLLAMPMAGANMNANVNANANSNEKESLKVSAPMPKIKLSMKRKAPNLELSSRSDEKTIASSPKPKLKLKLGGLVETSRPIEPPDDNDDEPGPGRSDEKMIASSPKPKLKLKLGGLVETSRPIEPPDDDDDEFPDLKITLKKDSGPLPLLSSIHKAGNSRSTDTDLVSMQNRIGDDEWLPDETDLTNTHTRTLIQNSNTVTGHKKKTAKKASLPKKKTAKGNSRSRLMKKLNF